MSETKIEIEIQVLPEVPAKPVKEVKEVNTKRIKDDGTQPRWIVITLVMYLFLAEGCTKTCFGQVNNIVAQYFRISMEEVDWLTVAPSASSAFSLFLMTWLTASGLVGLRAWCLTSASLITISFACIDLSVFSRDLFPLAVLGQIIAGMANAINFSIAPLMASSWFKENEAPTAIALTYVGLNAGNIVGFMIPTQTLPKRNHTQAPYDFHDNLTNEDPDWGPRVSMALSAIFSSFLIASMVIVFVSFLYILDAPTPLQLLKAEEIQDRRRLCVPTERCSLRRNSSVFQLKINRVKSATRKTIFSWFMASKTLLTEKKFMVLAIPHSIILPMCLIWFALMSDVLRSSSFNNVLFVDVANATSFNASTGVYVTTSTVISGYIMVMYCVGGALGGALTGKVSQLFKFHYARISCGATWGVAATSVGITFGIKFNSIETMFIFNFLFGFFVPIAVTSLVAMVIECVTSVERLTVGTWLAIFSCTTASLLPIFGRFLLESFGPISLGIFQTTSVTIVAIFLIFVKKFIS